MVCSSFSDSWFRATPLVSAMNTAFPEASWAWRNGICRCRAKGSTEADFPAPCPAVGTCASLTTPTPGPSSQPPHTHPFADQVVGEVSGQHVRAKSLHHVLTVNLGMWVGKW